MKTQWHGEKSLLVVSVELGINGHRPVTSK
jgi:hypothetical protein